MYVFHSEQSLLSHCFGEDFPNYRILKGAVQGEGVFLGNPEDSGREDWGTLGNIRED